MRSMSKLDNGFSIFCMKSQVSGVHGKEQHYLTLRLLRRFSMSLLRSCSSDICPDTAERSF